MPNKYEQAIALIDAENAKDPERDGDQPKTLLYGQRMAECLDQFAPGSPDYLKIAARAQHIRRWDIPRDTYPRDRSGYHLWRTKLYSYHAEVTGKILREAGYSDETIDRVGDLLMKRRIKSDPDMQTLEDVICLVFLTYYFDDFAAAHEDDKLITILQRTWNKMSDKGHDAALQLDLSDRAVSLVERALGG
ncbi:DUF4202 domain-containing protein [Planctomycetales bacterium ZRK34]|nr:DUF4202 domain-containing protein [Planctomycetales bacterium ZRK34]